MNNRLKWQAGAYEENVEPLSLVGSQSPVLHRLHRTRIPSIASARSVPVSARSTIRRGRQYFNNAGVYEQSTYSLTDTLKADGRLRYTWDQTHDQQPAHHLYGPGRHLYPAQHPVCTDADLDASRLHVHYQENSSAPTWLLDLDYTPTDDILVYGKYTRGYRAGGVAPQCAG